MKRLARTTALLLALSALACGDTTTTRFCSFNSDCPDSGTPYCINGTCQPDECRADRDCPGEETCVEGVCAG